MESTNLHKSSRKILVLTDFAVSEICDEKRFTQSRKDAKKVENLAFLAARAPARVLRGNIKATTKNSRIRKIPDSAGICGFTALPGDESPGQVAAPCEQG